MLGGTDLGPGNLIEILGLVGQAVLDGTTAAGSSASVVNTNYANMAVNAYKNGTLRLFTKSGADQPTVMMESIVQSNTGSEFTVSPDLPSAPSDDQLWVVIPAVLDITVDAPMDIEEVNGAAVTFSSLLSPNTSIGAPRAVTVGTAAVQLDTGLANRRYITVVNNGTATIYIGGADTVTTANGIPIAAGASATYNLGPSLALYGISTANQDTRIMEVA